jgi:hypothetical protein
VILTSIFPWKWLDLGKDSDYYKMKHNLKKEKGNEEGDLNEELLKGYENENFKNTYYSPNNGKGILINF